MVAHILISRSHRFPLNAEPQFVGWIYSREVGVWTPDPESGEGASRPERPVSKKADQETGEDMKGP